MEEFGLKSTKSGLEAAGVKKVKEAFMNIIPTEKNSRFLLVLTIIIAFFYFVSK